MECRSLLPSLVPTVSPHCRDEDIDGEIRDEQRDEPKGNAENQLRGRHGIRRLAGLCRHRSLVTKADLLAIEGST